jgi:hypothetical protein
MPPERSSNEPTTCLAFRYQGQTSNLEGIPEAVELGLRLLIPIANELRRNNYEASEPFAGKKSFGITGMTCRTKEGELSISVWPPSRGDEWQVRTTWLHRLDPSSEMTQSERPMWNAIPQILNGVIARLDGTRDLRWLSLQEVRELELRSLSNPKRVDSNRKD